MHKATHMCIALILPASERFSRFFSPLHNDGVQECARATCEALLSSSEHSEELKFIISMWMLIMVSFAGTQNARKLTRNFLSPASSWTSGFTLIECLLNLSLRAPMFVVEWAPNSEKLTDNFARNWSRFIVPNGPLGRLLRCFRVCFNKTFEIDTFCWRCFVGDEPAFVCRTRLERA